MLGITSDEICNGKLDSKMTLNSFIINMSKVGADSGMIALRVWEQVPDHQYFLKSLLDSKDVDSEGNEVLNIL